MDRQLRTRRLLLRAPQPGDAPWAFERWASQPQLLQHLGWRAHTELAQTTALLNWEQARWQKRSAWTWLLLPYGEAGPVGQIQLLPQRLDGPAQHLRLGYVMASAWQRKGLMREALASVIDHALTQPDTWRIDALVDVDNPASHALLHSLGLHCEGRLARCLPQPAQGPEPHDAWLFATWRGGPGLSNAPANPATPAA